MHTKIQLAYIPQSATGRINTNCTNQTAQCVRFDGLTTAGFSTCNIMIILNESKTCGSLMHCDGQNDPSMIVKEIKLINKWCNGSIYLYHNEKGIETKSLILNKLKSLNLNHNINIKKLSSDQQFIILQNVKGRLEITIKSIVQFFDAIDCKTDINIKHSLKELQFKYLRKLESKLQVIEIIKYKLKQNVIIFENNKFIDVQIDKIFEDTINFLNKVNIKNDFDSIYQFAQLLTMKYFKNRDILDVTEFAAEELLCMDVVFPIQLHLNKYDLVKCWLFNSISCIQKIQNNKLLTKMHINIKSQIIKNITLFINSLKMCSDQMFVADIGALHSIQKMEIQNQIEKSILIYIDNEFSVNSASFVSIKASKSLEIHLIRWVEAIKKAKKQNNFSNIINLLNEEGNKNLIRQYCNYAGVDNLISDIMYTTILCGMQSMKQLKKKKKKQQKKKKKKKRSKKSDDYNLPNERLVLDACNYAASILSVDDVCLFLVLAV